MDTSDLIMIIALILLIIMSSYFSATETAFNSYNRIRMRNREEKGDRKAALALRLSEDYDKLLSTILIGNNIVNITATTIATVLFTNLIGSEYGPTTATIVLTLLVLLFGEISPKSYAKKYPEKFACFSAPILRVFLVILSPLNVFFSLWQRLMNVITKGEADPGITEEELITMVSEAENEGGLDEHESRLIQSAINFDDLEVSDILTPRVDISAISREATAEEAATIFAESGYSRLPVYEKTIDNIIGVIHEKDFYAARYRGSEDIKTLISKIYYTTPSTHIDELMRQLQVEKLHMAVVVDEYGGTEGIVTMEDIIEELVGEIWDEHDEVIQEINKQADGSYLINCNADLSDLFDLFSIRSDEDIPTVSGWVVDNLEHIPKVGDTFEAEGLEVTVTRTARRRALEVRVTKLPEEEQEGQTP